MYFFSRRLPLHLLAQCNYLTHSSLALLRPYENKKSKQKISTYLLHMKIKQVTVFPHFSFAKMMGRRKIKAIFTLSLNRFSCQHQNALRHNQENPSVMWLSTLTADRRGAPSTRYRNHAKITILMCEQRRYIRHGFRASAKAIRHRVNSLNSRLWVFKNGTFRWCHIFSIILSKYFAVLDWLKLKPPANSS